MTEIQDIEDDAPPSAAPGPARRSPWRWAKWVAIGIVAVVALGYGAIFFYANVLNDAPAEFDETDLSEALVATTVADQAPAGSPASPVDTVAPAGSAVPGDAPTTVAAADPATTDGATVGASAFDGEWVPTGSSEFGYRVEEVLAGVNTTAVGRGNGITGSLTIDGTAVSTLDVTVDVASITSDNGRRDGQFRGRIMETDRFPTATFTLTAPIDLGAIPAEGDQVVATATGDLTLHGVTRNVTFDVTAQATDGRIGVLGSIPILFADYDIDNPSFGSVKTEDDGLLEFVLVFERP